MALSTIAAGVGILLLTVAWYGLQVAALRDLRVRPRVRGDNKLVWAFAILCFPFIGALGYLSMGPTSLLLGSDPRRDPLRYAPARPSQEVAAPPPSRPATPERIPTLTTTKAGSRPVRPTARRRTAMAPAERTFQGLAVDPMIGTDSAELLPTRVSIARSRRPLPDAIRWPGTSIPQTWQQINADLHDENY